MSNRNNRLQDIYLNLLRKEKIPVVVHLLNGTHLKGTISGFDSFVVLLKQGVQQVIYKHAISTILPEREVGIRSTPPNPLLTVDAIVEVEGGIVLIKRRNPPHGWALPGGFVDYGESVEEAITREVKEETGLDIRLIRQFHAYSDPKRDPRQHTVSIVFIATASGRPRAGDDAMEAGIFTRDSLPKDIVFDHRQILDDYFNRKY